MSFSLTRLAWMLALAVLLQGSAAQAQKAYGPGVTDKEIKIGSIMPFSGPASGFSIVGKAEAAYFRKINDEGGINGRKVNLITYDDGYSPPKTVEQVRRLVESDEVLLMFSPLGTAGNTAIQKYLNGRKIPHLFPSSRSSKWKDPKQFPWTIGLTPSYFDEGQAYAKFLRDQHPDAKVGVIYQNDDFGKDVLNGLRTGLGEKASSAIVAAEAFEITEPTVESRVVKLKAMDADVVVNISSPKAAAQVIKKIHDLDWKPIHIIANVSASIEAVMKPAGLDISEGIISATYAKDGTDPQWAADQEVVDFDRFLAKYYPEADRSDVLVIAGYISAEALVQVLTACGDDLTRDNILRQVTHMRDLRLPMTLPGILVNTTPTDYSSIRQLRLMKLENSRWHLFEDLTEPPQ